MAKVVQIAEQIDLDLSELRQLKTDVVQQPNSAQSALQLKSRVLLGPDDMHMRRFCRNRRVLVRSADEV